MAPGGFGEKLSFRNLQYTTPLQLPHVPASILFNVGYCFLVWFASDHEVEQWRGRTTQYDRSSALLRGLPVQTIWLNDRLLSHPLKAVHQFLNICCLAVRLEEFTIIQI